MNAKCIVRLAVSSLCLLAASSFAADPLRIGLIGLDTSHVSVFTKMLNDEKAPDHVPGGKVVAAFKGGSKDIQSSWSRVDKFTDELQTKHGVKIVPTIEALCQEVDAVMLTSVDGRPHLAQARPVLQARKPLFIDKPLAASLKDAVEIFRLAQETKTPCYSGSSLRFFSTLTELKQEAKYGQLQGAFSTGPAHYEPHHPDLFWYGIHAVESLYTLMGTGCVTVVRTASPFADEVTGQWTDGKVGTVRGIREGGASPFRVTAFGSKAVVDQKPEKSGSGYVVQLQEIIKFFQTGVSPVPAAETLEIIAFMEAADESKRQGGKPVNLRDLLMQAGAEPLLK